MPTRSQKLIIALAFLAAALSLAACGIRFFRDGTVPVMPFAGGLLMLALGVGGCLRIKRF